MSAISLNEPTHFLQEFKETISLGLEKTTQRFIHEQCFLHKDDADLASLRKKIHIPYIRLTTPHFDANALLKEATALSSQFVLHGFDGNCGWKSLCLHGIDSHKTLSCDRYGYKNENDAPYNWTEVSTQCPQILSWLKSLILEDYFEKFYRVRLMLLEPNGYVRYHRDIPQQERRLGPMNVALNMPNNCFFLFKAWGQVPFTAGSTFLLDISQEHGVWNNSYEPRVHIIIHGVYGKNYFLQLQKNIKKITLGSPRHV